MGFKETVLLIAGCGMTVFIMSDALDHKLDAQLQQDEYCSMVKLNQTSKGELGWPDYRKKYKELCE
jgi:hypothetical protein